MNGLGDSLTIVIVLTLIFGAAFFYLYSRLSLNEKRVSLLENLLLSLKMSTEASLMGPDMVEATSSPAPLEKGDVDEVSEVDYADMLKGIGEAKPLVVNNQETVSDDVPAQGDSRPVDAEAVKPVESVSIRKMDANYESLSLKELQALARQRGISGLPNRKREIVDALKKQGNASASSVTSAFLEPTPLPVAEGELEGASQEVKTGSFNVEMDQAP